MSIGAQPVGAERGQPEQPVSTESSVLFRAEPGACAGRLDPGQGLVPDWLVPLLDYHVWPSASPYPISLRARTVCEHIDYGLIWHQHPDLFARRGQVGNPALPELWEAKRVLAEEFGTALAFEVQLEKIDGELALGVYGAGVVGRLSDAEWHAVAGLLTTCSSTVREPRPDLERYGGTVRPARPPTGAGKRPLPSPVTPEGWQIGDWIHTWWSYPFYGTLRENCSCTAHTAEAAAVRFGPDTRAAT